MYVAISTHDGKTLHNDHYGDGTYFDIYELRPDGYTFLNRVANTTGEEEEHDHHHGDSKKASGIGQIVGRAGAQVLVAKAFGPNIKKMVKNFVPVLVKDDTIEQALETLRQNYDRIKEEWEKGENRTWLNLKR